MVPRLRILVATAWAGSLWTTAAYAAMLFATANSQFDRASAGMLAGLMFSAEAYITMGCAGLLAVLLFLSKDRTDAQKRNLLAFILAGVVCTLTVQFGLRPMMEALRAANPGPLSADMRTQFGLLHAGASLFYFIECILAAVVVVRAR